jgi:hypothetical protein
VALDGTIVPLKKLPEPAKVIESEPPVTH